VSHPSQYGRLRFCPTCGIDNVERDYFPGGTPTANAKQPKVGAEYVCKTCGFAFWISKSRRVLYAEQQFAKDRKRAPVKFTEACIGSEVTAQYLRESEPPMIKTMSNKLLAKLGLRAQLR
jgi:hypothetical protein